MYAHPHSLPPALRSMRHLHNDHVVLYRYRRATAASEANNWLAYEFLRQEHEDELRAATMDLPGKHFDEQIALANEITTLAIKINLQHISIVCVDYIGESHQLHVSAKSRSNKGFDEYIDLNDPDDAEFSLRRTNNRLRELVKTLQTISLRPVPGAPQAA